MKSRRIKSIFTTVVVVSIRLLFIGLIFLAVKLSNAGPEGTDEVTAWMESHSFLDSSGEAALPQDEHEQSRTRR